MTVKRFEFFLNDHLVLLILIDFMMMIVLCYTYDPSCAGHRNLDNHELNAFSIKIYFAFKSKFLDLPLIDPLK